MKIALIPGTPIVLPYFADAQAVAEHLEIQGNDAISLCTLTLYNGDEPSADRRLKVIFKKCQTTGKLLPEGKLRLSDYLFCSLKIFSVDAYKISEIHLHVRVLKPVKMQ